MLYKITFFLISISALFCSISVNAQQQKGKATYYSKRATGARTASGEKLHHDSLTCAHKFYPFGTFLKVTNLANDKSVVVKVTDRGPYGKGKIIDLSWGAAKEIDMLVQGVASVKVEVVESPIPLRPNEDLDLPLVDFEVAEARYSFIENWKEHMQSENNNTKKKTQKPTHPKKKAKLILANQNEKKSLEVKTQMKTEQKEKTNSWNNVFEKVKNWGESFFE